MEHSLTGSSNGRSKRNHVLILILMEHSLTTEIEVRTTITRES